MKRAALLLLVLLACSKKQGSSLPVIVSFTVDNASPDQGDPITFSWQVTGATTVGIFPEPGTVTSSPVTVTPIASGTFVLKADNAAGSVQQPISIVFAASPPVAVTHFTALPAQVAPGAQVTLSWTLTAAVSASLSDGSGSAPVDVLGLTSMKVNPTATTVYTLTALAKEHHVPASASAKAVARVATPTAASSFAASPSAITQGDASTLSWDGNASNWSVSDGTTVTPLGPLKSLVVRPAVNTTYTLQGSGPGGALSPQPAATVTVTPHPGSALIYSEPAAGAQPLKLTAISCAGAATCTLALVAASAVSLRGVALDLPADSTKVTVTAASTSLSTPAFKTALGSGPLEDTLVLGAALEGTGVAPASDVAFAPGDEVARFTLTFVANGGRGNVFDGTTSAGAAAIRSFLQNAAGRSAGVIAVGKLDQN